MCQFCLIVSLLLTFTCGAPAVPQQKLITEHAETVQSAAVVIVKLFEPKYPPLAWTANITGDVQLKLGIRKDGNVASAVALSGHPLLRDAALNSARESRFNCSGCTDEVTFYSMVYSYRVVAGPDFPCPESPLHVVQSENHVTLTGEPRVVDPYFSNLRAGSPKCLYLWNCGVQWGGWDYYYEPVRSAKCLDLWSCGHRLREPWARCKALHRDIW
jgi:hypothetical protein